MTSSEKFCLKWNVFENNITSSFHGLRENQDFSDLTLVCEEDKQIEAHRVILSACSPFFSSVLKRNKHTPPMIYMRGMKYKDLVAIVDFIYHGEANIYQEDLDGFLALTEELQLKGLTGTNEEPMKEKKADAENVKLTEPKNQIFVKQESLTHNFDMNAAIEKFYNTNEDKYENKSMVPAESDRIVATNNEDLKFKIASMMESIIEGDFRYKCKVCGKADKDKTNMGRHVESHIEGVSHSCNLCGKISRSGNALRMHISNHHRQLFVHVAGPQMPFKLMCQYITENKYSFSGQRMP